MNSSNGISVQRMKYQNDVNQKNQIIEQLNQRLEEANEQLLKNKEYIMELLQVKEKEVYDA